jgi:alpha-galactosidase
VGAVCDPEEVWQMTDEMLVAQAQWLAQYGRAILQAKQNLALHERNSTRVKLRDTKGAVRIPIKSVEELAKDKEAAKANAAAADKGKMTAPVAAK